MPAQDVQHSPRPQAHYAAIQHSDIPALKHYGVNTGSSATDGWIRQLGRLNIFVGQNNSGKSRFLRGLFSAPRFGFDSSQLSLYELEELVQPVRRFLHERLIGPLTGYGAVRRNMLDEEQIAYGGKQQHVLEAALRKLQAIVENKDFSTISTHSIDHMRESPQMIHQSLLPIAQKAFEKLSGPLPDLGDEPRVYIPILRGLRPLSSQGRPADFYREATERHYGLKADVNRQIFTGLSLYEELADLLLGDASGRERAADYQRFLSVEFFDGLPISLVPRRNTDTVFVRIGQTEDRAIHDLGDGIQSLITLTFPAFAASSRTLFFIEEPEVHLHPGLQRRLVDLFLRHEMLKNHQFFITTHSNHIMDISEYQQETSCYVFRKSNAASTALQETFSISPVPGLHKSILAELGARSSSVFLTNATIFVEGVTDRLYLREFIAKYLRDRNQEGRFRLDTHYSFVEYGGANLVHWNFGEFDDRFREAISVTRLCSNAAVVIDGDVRKHPDRIENVRTALPTSTIVLQGKEIENLLPVEALEYAASNFRSTAIRIGQLSLDAYHRKDIGIGKYLDDNVGARVFSKPSGTIRDKGRFCTLATSFLRTNDSWKLPPETEMVCKQLVDFIEASNAPPLPAK